MTKECLLCISRFHYKFERYFFKLKATRTTMVKFKGMYAASVKNNCILSKLDDWSTLTGSHFGYSLVRVLFCMCFINNPPNPDFLGNNENFWRTKNQLRWSYKNARMLRNVFYLFKSWVEGKGTLFTPCMCICINHTRKILISFITHKRKQQPFSVSLTCLFVAYF